MKKIIVYIICVILLFSGCNVQKQQNNEEKIKVTATSFPIYDFAKNICGDLAEVELLVPFGSESHSFEPTPTDIIKLSKSDLFIYVGGENEIWVEDILNSTELSDDKTLKLENVIEFLPYETEHHHKEYDEHIWTSVKNASKICRAVTDELKKADAENSEKYEENFNLYNEKLLSLDKEFSEIVSNSQRKTIVFGDRFPFLYFVSDYGLEYYSVFSGCSSETEPSAVKIAELTEKIKEESIPVVFHIEYSNENVADILCKSTGAKKMLFHSCHTITKDDYENGASYISLMRKNAEALKEAIY